MLVSPTHRLHQGRGYVLLSTLLYSLCLEQGLALTWCLGASVQEEEEEESTGLHRLALLPHSGLPCLHQLWQGHPLRVF